MSVSTDKNFKSKLSKLKAWLIEIYGDCEIIPHADSIASGFSNETFVFDVSGENVTESLVLRLRPTGYQVFPDYDLKQQASIMKLLRSKGLPTPEIIFENYYMNYSIDDIYVDTRWFRRHRRRLIRLREREENSERNREIHRQMKEKRRIENEKKKRQQRKEKKQRNRELNEELKNLT